MSKKSKHRRRSGARPPERGRFQVLHPETGTPFIFSTRDEAAHFALNEIGAPFFYEMDDKGPFFESPVWVYSFELNAEDPKYVDLVRKSFAELEREHDANPCGCQCGTIH